MLLNTFVIDTYMENKEVWVVVLVLGFVLLLNSNSFTGQAYTPRPGAETSLRQGQTFSPVSPAGYATQPRNPYLLGFERDITAPRGSGYFSRYNTRQSQEIPVTSSPVSSGTPGYQQESPDYRYAKSQFPNKMPDYNPSEFRQPGQQGITPRGYTQEVRQRY